MKVTLASDRSDPCRHRTPARVTPQEAEDFRVSLPGFRSVATRFKQRAGRSAAESRTR